MPTTEVGAAPDLPPPEARSRRRPPRDPDRRLRARRHAHRSRRRAPGAAGVGRAARRAVRRVGAERSDRQRPLGTLPRLAEALDAIGYRADAQHARGAPAGVDVVVDAARLRSPALRLRERQLADPAGRDPAPHHHPPGRPAAAGRPRARRPRSSASAGGSSTSCAARATSRPTCASTRGPARRPGAVDLYVRIDAGPSYPLGPDHVHRQPRDLHRGDRPDVPPPRLGQRSGSSPVPFTQKQLREDIDAPRPSATGPSATSARASRTDFSVQKSIDRDAKNVRLGITDQRAQADQPSRSRATAQQSSSTLQDELTLFDARLVRRLRGRPPAPTPSSATTSSRATSSRASSGVASGSSADEERIVFIVDEGPELKVRDVEFVGNRVAARRGAGRGRLGAHATRSWLGLGAGGYVTGQQMEQDVERLVEHYHARASPRPRPTSTPRPRGEALGALGADRRRRRDRVARREGDLRALHDRRGPARDRSAPRTSAPPTASPLPYDQQFLLESVTAAPGRALHPGGGPRGRPPPRAPARRRRLLRRDASSPTSSRTGDRRRAHLGAQARPARARRPDLRARQLRHHARDHPRADPAALGRLLTTTAIERGQRNLGFLQLFNNATPISFPGKDEKRAVVPMVVEVEERYEQYSVIHALAWRRGPAWGWSGCARSRST